MLINQGWFTALNTLHLLDSQSFEYEICLLQALSMPLIRCTNVFFQGRLSRHITSPSEKTRPESLPGDYMGKAQGGGGDTLIFCGYIGEAPASTPKPKKLLRFADHPPPHKKNTSPIRHT